MHCSPFAAYRSDAPEIVLGVALLTLALVGAIALAAGVL